MAAGLAGTAACSRAATPATGKSSAPTATTPVDPRSQLAAHAAVAKDRRYTAKYSLASGTGRAPQKVAVTLAEDGSWRVDVAGGALSGTVDIALVGAMGGQYQCALASTKYTGCVRVANFGETLPSAINPRVQYAFTDWLDLLTDTGAAITVTVTEPLPNATGTCFGVEPTTVTLAPAIESAQFCYADDGTLTAVRAGFGVLTLTESPGTAPPGISLPGATVNRAALPLVAPPAPSPSSSKSAPSTPARR